VERSKLTSVTSYAEFIDSKFSCPSASARAQHDDRNLFNDAPFALGLMAWNMLGRERQYGNDFVNSWMNLRLSLCQ
jgi:hypothetical protein